MTDRAAFNRRYTSFTPGTTQVWLVNGAGVTTSPATTLSFTAGENLIQGQVVYVSGTYVLSSSAASGVRPEVWTAAGITAEAASASSAVNVILDDVALVSSGNLIHETSLTPGQYYYVSNITGKLTSVTAPSGITASGGYGAATVVGLALSPSELHVEIGSPVTLT
jgi:hypothetical protein